MLWKKNKENARIKPEVILQESMYLKQVEIRG